jgi:hypothetical protein
LSPVASSSTPIANNVVMEATKPPMLVIPDAVPCRSGGFAGRAKSNPIMEAGPHAPSTAHSTTSSHMGSRSPGYASALAQTTAVAVTVPSASGSRAA